MGDILIWLGKMVATLAGAIVAFAVSDIKFYADPMSESYLSTPLVPIGVAIIMAYGIASLFFSVYELAVDTIMLSFCDDCDRHGGNPRFAPPQLQEAIGKAGPPQGVAPEQSPKV